MSHVSICCVVNVVGRRWNGDVLYDALQFRSACTSFGKKLRIMMLELEVRIRVNELDTLICPRSRQRCIKDQMLIPE